MVTIDIVTLKGLRKISHVQGQTSLITASKEGSNFIRACKSRCFFLVRTFFGGLLVAQFNEIPKSELFAHKSCWSSHVRLVVAYDLIYCISPSFRVFDLDDVPLKIPPHFLDPAKKSYTKLRSPRPYHACKHLTYGDVPRWQK